MITLFDVIVVSVTFILVLMGYVSFFALRLETPKHLTVCVSVFLILTSVYVGYRFVTTPDFEPQVYTQYLGKFEKIVSVGGGRYPTVVYKTNTQC